jgi:carboxypeptidase PM20D1
MGAIARLLALSVWFWSLDLQLPSLQVHPGDSPTLLPMDKEQAVQRLRKSLTYPTITGSPGFTAFHSFLEQSFPLVHEHLEKTVLQNHSLVYYWPGSDPRLKPALFLAHQDVVPVTAEANWTFPPFSGKVSKGFIYGRGALDMKSVLMAQLDVIESLLKAKKTLSRSIYLFSGHDE